MNLFGFISTGSRSVYGVQFLGLLNILNLVQKLQIGIGQELLLVYSQVLLREIVVVVSTHSFSETIFFFEFSFPSRMVSHFSLCRGKFFLQNLVLYFDSAFLLVTKRNELSEFSLEFIEATVAAISLNLISVGMRNGDESMCHFFIFCLYFVLSVVGQIAVILLLCDLMDGVGEGIWKLMLYCGSCSSDVVIVLSFVLKVEKIFGAFGHVIFIYRGGINQVINC